MLHTPAPELHFCAVLLSRTSHVSEISKPLKVKRVCSSRTQYRGADKTLAQPTSRCILFDGENISFDASLVIYIYIYIVLIFLQL